jgi:ferredoxin-NADP reductase
VEGTAVLGRLTWRIVTIAESRPETPSAKTVVLDVPDWPGHAAGQHVDIRLTADDGYQAERSYSIASPPGAAALELTIERIDDGEVSPYLTEEARPGDEFELRGPIGGYFVWDGSDDRPVLLVAGGSGIVPLMAMIRYHKAIASGAEVRLLLSARSIDDVLYRDELDALSSPVAVTITLTRGEPPPGWSGLMGRIDHDKLAAIGPGPEQRPAVYVCGPTPFVEEAARLLVELGHDPANVFTERFGPTGG